MTRAIWTRLDGTLTDASLQAVLASPNEGDESVTSCPQAARNRLGAWIRGPSLRDVSLRQTTGHVRTGLGRSGQVVGECRSGLLLAGDVVVAAVLVLLA